MALDGLTLFLRVKDVTNTHKQMRRSQVLAGVLQCNDGKLEEAEDSKCGCVRIEIDQPRCLIC